jgi:uncharacterized RDD family membrane protein YckC
MSQPTGGPQSGPPSWQQPPQQPASPPPPQSWQQAPRQPQAPVPPPSQPPSWAANLTSTAPVAGPAGFVYGDVPNRAIAYIIDYIIMILVGVVIGAIALAILGDRVTISNGTVTYVNPASSLVTTLLSYAVIAGYFFFTWTRMRATVGMRLLGMQIGHEADGRTMSTEQAIIRIGAMFGPGFVASLVAAFALGLSSILGLVAFIWFLALLYTTAKSPTKQGLHDQYAHTMVVKAARRAG